MDKDAEQSMTVVIAVSTTEVATKKRKTKKVEKRVASGCPVFGCSNHTVLFLCRYHWYRLEKSDQENYKTIAAGGDAVGMQLFRKQLLERIANQEAEMQLTVFKATHNIPQDVAAFLYEERQKLDRRIARYHQMYKQTIENLKQDGRSADVLVIKRDFDRMCKLALDNFCHEFSRFDVEIDFEGLPQPDEFDVMLEPAS